MIVNDIFLLFLECINYFRKINDVLQVTNKNNLDLRRNSVEDVHTVLIVSITSPFLPNLR